MWNQYLRSYQYIKTMLQDGAIAAMGNNEYMYFK